MNCNSKAKYVASASLRPYDMRRPQIPACAPPDVSRCVVVDRCVKQERTTPLPPFFMRPQVVDSRLPNTNLPGKESKLENYILADQLSTHYYDLQVTPYQGNWKVQNLEVYKDPRAGMITNDTNQLKSLPC